MGPYNPISLAFAVLFIGLGVDFGIQFAVRYRAERHMPGDLRQALVAAGAGVGGSIALATASIAAGFFAFLPTDYSGVSELGLIAGTGMLVAFVLSLTLLPALLRLLRPRGEAGEIGYRWLAPLDRFLIRRRRLVLTLAGILAICFAVLLPRLSFDFNPLNLRSPKTESVATILDLMKDRSTSPYTIEVLAPSLAEAQKEAERLSKLPVSRPGDHSGELRAPGTERQARPHPGCGHADRPDPAAGRDQAATHGPAGRRLAEARRGGAHRRRRQQARTGRHGVRSALRGWRMRSPPPRRSAARKPKPRSSPG